MLKAHAVLAALLAAAVVAAPSARSHPPPSLETKLMPYPFWTEPQSDDIYHVPTGLKLSFEGMMGMLSGARVVYLGEIHNNVHDHRIQYEILRELAARFPGRVAIGMEMFRTPQQGSLDRWTADELSEVEFLKESGWYENWQMNFLYYRDILALARQEGIDVVALNPPMDLQRQVGMAGPGGLPPEVAAGLPDTDSSDPYQRALIRSVYDGHEGSEAMYEAFLRVHLLWEETMASRIAEYLGSERGDGKIMVVLTGGTHVKYGFGVPKKVVRRLPLPYSVVLTAPISSPGTHGGAHGDAGAEGQAAPERPVFMDVKVPEVPLLAADFIWAVPYETIPDEKVRVGISLNFSGGEGAIDEVLENSAADLAGVIPGDVLLRLDDTAVTEMADVTIFLRSKRFGDTVSLGIRRNGEELSLEATFQRLAG